MDLAKFKEEMEREITSLLAAVSELRALVPDLDVDKLCGVRNTNTSMREVVSLLSRRGRIANTFPLSSCRSTIPQRTSTCKWSS
jgi:hypothetical protein